MSLGGVDFRSFGARRRDIDNAVPRPATRGLSTLLFLAVLALLAGGCGTRLTIEPTIAPTVAIASLTVEELAEARRFRIEFGLRADDDWITAVEALPEANEEFGVRLTPQEAADIRQRPLLSDPVASTVDAYGREHQSEWAGLYIDQTRGGSVVALFTGGIEDHETALRAILHPAARLEVRAARWSLKDLQELAERVVAEERWFESIDAKWRGTGVDKSKNRVLIEISSANPEAPDLIEAHFQAEGMVDVVSDQTGALLLPPGVLIGRAVDSAGKPVRGLQCVPIPDVSGAFDDASTYGTDRTGTCKIPVRAGWYTLEFGRIGAAGVRVVGTARANVPSEGQALVVVIVQE